MGLLYVRTGNNGGDAAYLIPDLGFTVPTGATWTLLSASSPADADGSSGIFSAREIRDSADLYAAINGGQLEWSKDGNQEEDGADYVADYMVMQDLTDDFFNASSGRFALPNGTSTPASGVEGEMYWDSDDDAIHVWDGSQWVDVPTTISGHMHHHELLGLDDDDHTQYLNETRHDSLPADNPHSVTFTQAVTADSGTDISAAEAETLTDGSDADSLHTHAGYDAHVASGEIHFTEGDIDHNNILNNGTYSHSSIDSHIDDSSIHFTEASIDHGSIGGLGDDDHTQYVSLTGDENRNLITGKLNLVSGEMTLPQAADVAATFTSAVEGDIAWDTDDDALYLYDGAQWIVVATSSGVNTDHGALTGLGDDDHTQYLNETRHDSLPADNPHSVTFTQAVTADGNTDITAAEAETLTDGSNADSLHVHTASGVSLNHSDLGGIGTDDHHSELHTIASHSDTSATGAELDTLTDGSNADSLHEHDHGALSGILDDDHTQYVSLTGDGTRNTVTGKIDVSGGEFRLPQAADVITTFTSAEEGDMAWDVDDDSLWVYDGTEWFAVAPASGIITDHGELTGKDDDDHPQYTEWNNTETVSGLWTFNTAASDPAFVIAPDASAPSTNLADGAISVVGGILYTYDGTRTKWLSVDRKIVTAAKKGPTKDVYLRHADGIATSETGFRALRDGTITGITAQSDTTGTWTLEIRKNDSVTVITSVAVSAAQGAQDTTINIDFSQGDEIQFYANVSGSPVVSAIGAIEIAWRV